MAGIAVGNVADINQMNFNVINFNLDNYNKLNLGIQTQTVGPLNVLFIKSFTDLESAKRYLDAFNKNPAVYRSLDPKNFKTFVISIPNYGTLMADKDFDKYYLFYQKYYQQ